MRTKKELFTFKAGHISYQPEYIERVRAVQAISKQRVIVGLDNGILRIWEIESKQEVALPLLGHSKAITSLVLTLDGKRAISASEDTTLKVWDLENNLEVMTLRGHEHGFCDGQFSQMVNKLFTLLGIRPYR